MQGIGYLVDRREQEVNQRTVKDPEDLQGQKMLPVLATETEVRGSVAGAQGFRSLGHWVQGGITESLSGQG